MHSLRKNAAIKAYRNCETTKLFCVMRLKMLSRCYFMELECNVDIQSISIIVLCNSEDC